MSDILNMMELVVSETVVAITTHLRQVTPAHPINLSGFASRPKTLCNEDAAWDTQIPLAGTRCCACRRVAEAAGLTIRWTIPTPERLR